MDSANLRTRFFQLAIVNILSNIIIPLAGLVDIAFLGHLADIRYLAGVALATLLFDYLYRTCNFLRLGTTGPTAQAVGNSDPETVLLVLLRNGFIALSIGLLILLLQHPIAEIGFTLLSAAPEVKAAGRDYYEARIWGAPAVLINFVLIGWFIGREQSGKVLLLSIVGNGTNVLLDYLFINRWEWASAGAGAATATSQYLMLLLGIISICVEQDFSQVKMLAGRIFDWNALKLAFELNGNIWIRTLIGVTTFAIFIDLSSLFGTLVLAANTLLVEVLAIAAFFLEGSAFATETLTGIFRGKDADDSLAPLLQLSVATSLVLGLIFASIFILLPNTMFGLLTSHGEAIDQINRYILWLLPVLISFSLTFVLEGYFLGLTEGKIIRNSAVVAVFLGFIPIILLAWEFHDTQMLWLAILLFFGIKSIILGTYVPSTLDLKKAEKNFSA